ncbi:DedA family protein [Romboutsia lituseburensis]|uniref:DedA family protein n=1 Tax=Romboutsia lituseburensis TaxID=1537 RepID=UPI00215AA312|nr:DedA family protein [Romboutsia lituseburensis]MCR8743861.1 DedA family protein [Romboutsia lituseburensis]
MDINTLLKHFMEQYGLISIFVIVMLEYANFPLPSEVVLPLAGIMASNLNISFITVLGISVLGGIIGSITNYLIGLYFGKPFIKYILTKFPRVKKSVHSSVNYLEKYGKISVMIARIVPIARTFISIPAGVTKMNITWFTFYSFIGIAIWNSILIYLGYILGDNLSHITLIMKNYSIAIVSIIFIFIGIYYIKKKYTKFKKEK